MPPVSTKERVTRQSSAASKGRDTVGSDDTAPLSPSPCCADSTPEAARGRVLLLLVALAHVALVLYAAADLRGSDQYWYVADVEALMHGVTTTNQVYPVNIWKNTPLPPSFIHHILNLYLALPFALLLGDAYHGWIAINLLMSLAVAWVMRQTMRQVLGDLAADVAAGIWLLLPITIWTTSQPSAETTTAGVLALALFVTVRARGLTSWLAATLLWGAAYYCRAFYGPILLLMPWLFARWGEPKPVSRKLGVILLLGITGLVLLLIGPLLFPAGVLSITEGIRVRSSVPGLMASYMVWSMPEMNWLGFVRNGLGQLARSVVPIDPTLLIFYLPFLVLATIGLLTWRQVSPEVVRRVRAITAILVGLTLIVFFLHVNHFRFLLPLFPGLLCISICRPSIAGRSLDARRWPSLLLVLVILNLPLAHHLRVSSLSEGRQWRLVRKQLDRVIPADDPVMSANLGVGAHGQPLAYYLRPRLLGSFARDRTSRAEFALFKERLRARWLVDLSDSPIAARESATAVISQLSPPLDRCSLWRLP